MTIKPPVVMRRDPLVTDDISLGFEPGDIVINLLTGVHWYMETAGGGWIEVPGGLETVNADVGSFTSANITVDEKGRVTSAADGSGGGGGFLISTGTISLTNDQLLHLFSSPVELVAAPGPGKTLVLVSVWFELIFNTTPFILGGGSGPFIQYSGGAPAASADLGAGFNGSASSVGQQNNAAGLVENSSGQNKSFQLTVDTGNPTAGDSTGAVGIVYYIADETAGSGGTSILGVQFSETVPGVNDSQLFTGSGSATITTAGGSLNLATGANGGSISIKPGAQSGTGADGVSVSVDAGDAGPIGRGGTAYLRGGAGQSASIPGRFEANGVPDDDGSGNGNGGDALAATGDGAGTGKGGDLVISIGNSGNGATGNGGSMSIDLGNSAATNGDAGDLTIILGTGAGTGRNGVIKINLPTVDPGISGAFWADPVTHIVKISP